MKISFHKIELYENNERFEVFWAVPMTNVIFWDVTPCGSCKNRRFEETYPPPSG
jgi:hypothetical protein